MKKLLLGMATVCLMTTNAVAAIYLLPFETIQKKCQSQIAWEYIKRASEGKPKIRLIANGCYISSTNDIYVRNDLSPERTQEIIKHELRHQKGWRHY